MQWLKHHQPVPNQCKEGGPMAEEITKGVVWWRGEKLARNQALASSVRARRMSYIRRDEGGTTELRPAVGQNILVHSAAS